MRKLIAALCVVAILAAPVGCSLDDFLSGGQQVVTVGEDSLEKAEPVIAGLEQAMGRPLMPAERAAVIESIANQVETHGGTLSSILISLGLDGAGGAVGLIAAFGGLIAGFFRKRKQAAEAMRQRNRVALAASEAADAVEKGAGAGQELAYAAAGHGVADIIRDAYETRINSGKQ